MYTIGYMFDVNKAWLFAKKKKAKQVRWFVCSVLFCFLEERREDVESVEFEPQANREHKHGRSSDIDRCDQRV